jgi:hypothetical protein
VKQHTVPSKRSTDKTQSDAVGAVDSVTTPQNKKPAVHQDRYAPAQTSNQGSEPESYYATTALASSATALIYLLTSDI